MNLIVAYDISDNRQRARIAALLEQSGIRLQRSVFECKWQVDEALAATLTQFIDQNRDILHIFPICDTCLSKRRSLGQAPPDLDAPYWVI